MPNKHDGCKNQAFSIAVVVVVVFISNEIWSLKGNRIPRNENNNNKNWKLATTATTILTLSVCQQAGRLAVRQSACPSIHLSVRSKISRISNERQMNRRGIWYFIMNDILPNKNIISYIRSDIFTQSNIYIRTKIHTYISIYLLGCVR